MKNGVFLAYYDSHVAVLGYLFFFPVRNDEKNQFEDCYPDRYIVVSHCYDIFSSHKYARRKRMDHYFCDHFYLFWC